MSKSDDGDLPIFLAIVVVMAGMTFAIHATIDRVEDLETRVAALEAAK